MDFSFHVTPASNILPELQSGIRNRVTRFGVGASRDCEPNIFEVTARAPGGAVPMLVYVFVIINLRSQP